MFSRQKAKTRQAQICRYHDTDPIFDLCVKAQKYFEQYSYATRVKACSLISVDEVMQVAGVAALTLPPTLLHPLSEMTEPEAKVAALSLFKHNTKMEGQEVERRSFLDEEAQFREALAKRDGGKGRVKTTQVPSGFITSPCDCMPLLTLFGRQLTSSASINSRRRLL